MAINKKGIIKNAINKNGRGRLPNIGGTVAKTAKGTMGVASKIVKGAGNILGATTKGATNLVGKAVKGTGDALKTVTKGVTVGGKSSFMKDIDEVLERGSKTYSSGPSLPFSSWREKAAKLAEKEKYLAEVAKRGLGVAKNVSQDVSQSPAKSIGLLGTLGSLGALGATTVAAASPALYGAYKYKKELKAGAESSRIAGELADRRRQQVITNRQKKLQK